MLTEVAEAGGLVTVLGQPGLHKETLFLKKTEKKGCRMCLELLDLPARTYQPSCLSCVRMGAWPFSRQLRSDAPWSLHGVKSGPCMGL